MNDENRYLHPGATIEQEATTRASRTRLVLIIVVMVLALALLAWLLTPKGNKAPGGRYAGMGPMPVVGAAAHSGDMPITLIGLGAVTPLATVTVQSQISDELMLEPKEEALIKGNLIL